MTEDEAIALTATIVTRRDELTDLFKVAYDGNVHQALGLASWDDWLAEITTDPVEPTGTAGPPEKRPRARRARRGPTGQDQDPKPARARSAAPRASRDVEPRWKGQKR